MSEPKLTGQEIRYMLVVDYLSLPFEFRDFRDTMAKNGFELAPVRNLPPPPARIIYSGEMGRKKGTLVFADSEAGQIGVASKTLTETCTSFNDLIKIIDEEIGVNLLNKVKYFEISAHYSLDTGKNPLNQISKVQNKEIIENLAKIIGQEVTMSSIRLTKKGASVNEGNWLDIAIEPGSVYENKYHIGVIFRDSDKEKTENFVKDLEPNILKMIKIIEAE
jgi:hypothetical protein